MKVNIKVIGILILVTFFKKISTSGNIKVVCFAFALSILAYFLLIFLNMSKHKKYILFFIPLQVINYFYIISGERYLDLLLKNYFPILMILFLTIGLILKKNFIYSMIYQKAILDIDFIESNLSSRQKNKLLNICLVQSVCLIVTLVFLVWLGIEFNIGTSIISGMILSSFCILMVFWHFRRLAKILKVDVREIYAENLKPNLKSVE